MAFSTEFYTDTADASGEGKYILTDADIFIMRIVYEGSGVETEASDVTFTPATTPPTSGLNAWATDQFNSTTGLNLVTQSASNVFYGPVKDTTTTTIVFDPTTMFDSEDHTAGALGDWASGSTYNFRVMAPHATYAWGDWLGEVTGIKLTIKEDLAEFKRKVPVVTKRQDTKEIGYTISGEHFTPNVGAFRALMNGISYGSQSGGYETHFGSAPAARDKYMVTIRGSNVDGHEMLWQFFRTQFSVAGDIDFSKADYKSIPFKLTSFPDALRAGSRDMFRLLEDI